MRAELLRRQQAREVELWIARVRLAAVLFAGLEVGVFTENYPSGYESLAWIATGVFAFGAVVLLLVSRRAYTAWVGLASIVFDGAVIAAFATLYSFEYGSPTRWALMFVVVEGALRYGLVGAVGVSVSLFPFLAYVEWWRAREFGGPSFIWDRVTFPFGVFLTTGLIVGWLVNRLRRETAVAESRAREAEGLRDQLGRRVDVLEAANRCARALASSLEVDQAFGAFIRELRGLVDFDRVTIVLVEGGRAEVLAAAGLGIADVFPPGSARPVRGSVLEDVLEGSLVYRPTLDAERYPEEEDLLALGLRSRVLAPLQVGPRTIGMLGLVRTEVDAFSPEERELVALLGRLVATAVQNIRAYDAERTTAEELRRLSALRADFVSLVSHELRSPMAAVIGAARTLEARWRELSVEQRQAFLSLIGDETTRLAELIGDVLDTSRIEAGTFSFTFRDVDLSDLLRDVVAAAELGQDEVRVTAEVNGALPKVRGDRERLRQVVQNLVDNAVKYSPAGAEVRVRANVVDGRVLVEVEDAGPGISLDDQQLIFAKFGRATTDGGGKPGTGLGLFIARSIAEAHGGSVEVDSVPARGSIFTLELPLGVN
ncbi:MAG: two-component system, OmpR family, sensor histidine kinase KdpD [Gaiellaceae bacterium]|jgi:signal transduction histidine kinase|nr:two-component system, OmpR family, sensor histidine kinase KdpD [Gaiellaceae bacterium]